MNSARGTGKRIGDPALAARLRTALRGEVLFDPFTRGRYSTDASIYEIKPIGVALPLRACGQPLARPFLSRGPLAVHIRSHRRS